MCFLDESIQKIFSLSLKIEALVLQVHEVLEAQAARLNDDAAQLARMRDRIRTLQSTPQAPQYTHPGLSFSLPVPPAHDLGSYTADRRPGRAGRSLHHTELCVPSHDVSFYNSTASTWTLRPNSWVIKVQTSRSFIAPTTGPASTMNSKNTRMHNIVLLHVVCFAAAYSCCLRLLQSVTFCSKLNYVIFGFFDPTNNFFDNKNR